VAVAWDQRCSRRGNGIHLAHGNAYPFPSVATAGIWWPPSGDHCASRVRLPARKQVDGSFEARAHGRKRWLRRLACKWGERCVGDEHGDGDPCRAREGGEGGYRVELVICRCLLERMDLARPSPPEW
jgi:hypothetical protein